jgi:hypothetical protein
MDPARRLVHVRGAGTATGVTSCDAFVGQAKAAQRTSAAPISATTVGTGVLHRRREVSAVFARLKQ